MRKKSSLITVIARAEPDLYKYNSWPAEPSCSAHSLLHLGSQMCKVLPPRQMTISMHNLLDVIHDGLVRIQLAAPALQDQGRHYNCTDVTWETHLHAQALQIIMPALALAMFAMFCTCPSMLGVLTMVMLHMHEVKAPLHCLVPCPC